MVNIGKNLNCLVMMMEPIAVQQLKVWLKDVPWKLHYLLQCTIFTSTVASELCHSCHWCYLEFIPCLEWWSVCACTSWRNNTPNCMFMWLQAHTESHDWQKLFVFVTTAAHICQWCCLSQKWSLSLILQENKVPQHGWVLTVQCQLTTVPHGCMILHLECQRPKFWNLVFGQVCLLLLSFASALGL